MAGNKETWRTVVGAPEYEVSSLGRVRSKDWYIPAYESSTHKGGRYKRGGYTKPGRILSLTLNRTWYCRCAINSVTVEVQRLVAKSFIPMVKGKTYVNHKNSIRHDNRVENLEWCTQKENMAHSRASKVVR